MSNILAIRAGDEAIVLLTLAAIFLAVIIFGLSIIEMWRAEARHKEWVKTNKSRFGNVRRTQNNGEMK